MAFLATSRPEQALAFYRDVLGLQLLEDAQFAVVFDAFGIMLRIQKVAEVVRAPYTAFGLEVPDIDARVRELRARGVEPVRYAHFVQDELGIWTAPDDGTRVCWFRDPDGHVLSLTQLKAR